MDRCPYYAEYDRRRDNGDGTLFPLDISGTVFPYCQHKHSPVTRQIVLHTIGGHRLLTCGGDFDKCAVPKEKRLDIA